MIDNIFLFLKEYMGISSDEDYSYSPINIGMSGAQVYYLKIIKTSIPKFHGSFLLKVIRESEDGTINNSESYLSRKMYEEASLFRDHLVEVVLDASDDSYSYIVSSFVFGNNFVINALDMFSEHIILFEKISYDLLKLFNDTIESRRDRIISSLCADRLSEQGNFYPRVEDLLEKYDAESINFNGIILPNPVVFLSRVEDHLIENNYCFIYGHLHGDLNANNIMLVKEKGVIAKAEDYVIIDYANYKRGFLFFDHAYLELCFLEQMNADDKNDDSIQKWANIVDSVISGDSDNLSLKNKEYLLVHNAIVDGIEKWIGEERPYAEKDYIMQYNLAKVAAGINFFSKNSINEKARQKKFFLYTAISLKYIVEELKIEWDKEDTTSFRKPDGSNDDNFSLYNSFGRFGKEFERILITDDHYTDKDYSCLLGVGSFEWDIIVDLGSRTTGNDLNAAISSLLSEYQNYEEYICDNTAPLRIDVDARDTCRWIALKKEEGSGKAVIRKQIGRVVPILKSIIDVDPYKPLMILFDIYDEDFCKNVVERFFQDCIFKKNTRVIILRNSFEYLEEDFQDEGCLFFNYPELDLTFFQSLAESYGRRNKNESNILIPGFDKSYVQLTFDEVNRYNSSFEVIYDGLQYSESRTNENDAFLKGSLITWMDLELNRDVIREGFYYWLDKIRMWLVHNSGVDEKFLIHGPGSGGTTLSRRIMWTLKNEWPVVCLNIYTDRTSEYLCELYRKTHRCLLVFFENGSNIITDEEFQNMKRYIISETCRVLFIRIERRWETEKETNENIVLSMTMSNKEAEKFYSTYSVYCDSEEKIENLEKITNPPDNDWKEQRVPFFFGFYTYMESYRGLKSFIDACICNIDDKVNKLLEDVSLITSCTQTLAISYSEALSRVCRDENYSLFGFYQSMNNSCKRLLILDERGVRICHPLIAEHILKKIKGESNTFYYAADNFLDRMYEMYGEETEYVKKLNHGLFIQRDSIDDDRVDFSSLITKIEKNYFKDNLFKKLTEYYPRNTSYWSHWGRQQVFAENYNNAITYARKAVKISTDNKEDSSSNIHILGWVYSKKIMHDLKSFRVGRDTASRMIDEIKVDFDYASRYFMKMRKMCPDSTYGYFTNIMMICDTISMINSKTQKPIDRLIKEDFYFDKWYQEYVSVAVRLFAEMMENCRETITQRITETAKNKIYNIKSNIDALKEKLKNDNGVISEKHYNANLRRTISSIIYRDNNYHWKGMRKEDKKFIENEMKRNILDGDYTQSDLMYWLNVYRSQQGFDSLNAIKMIDDFMDDGYKKAYLKWMLSFEGFQRGLVSEMDVERKLEKCKEDSERELRRIRTSRFIDGYIEVNDGCHIMPIRELDQSEEGDYYDLKEFCGIIKDVRGTTSGTIVLNNTLGMKVFFSPAGKQGSVDISIKEEDITKPVKFYLMFSYSGLRAWQPVIIS